LLTGLTNAMLENASFFSEHAMEIDELTAGYRVVAHHVNFDYSFVKQEMKQSGITWTRKTLCTAELARFFYPMLASYSLSSLTKYFEIVNKRPHRAMSDAEATAQILLRIINDQGSSALQEILLSERKDYLIPAHLDDKIRNQLPAKPGVYYFIGKTGKPVYIGKAAKIKSRVLSHFRGDGNSLKILALGKQIKDIRFELTGEERLASLLEDHEIRHYWPVLNRSQKSNATRFGIVAYRNQKGNWKLSIATSGKLHCFIAVFHQYHLAVEFITKKSKEFQLDASHCGLWVGEKVAIKKHNSNFEIMLRQLKDKKTLILYFGKGRNKTEKSFICLENGQYKGFGFIPEEAKISTPDEVYKIITPRRSSVTSENIIRDLLESGDQPLILQESLSYE
jgi:DNA polymerase III subunit epsilon